jgi:RimJ/RimL family protein N-acetyltransferase
VSLAIRPVLLDDRQRYLEHLARIRAESGVDGDPPFTPVTPADRLDPAKVDFDGFARPVTEPKWRRGVALVLDDERFVGLAELKGDQFRAGLHRCELGIGIERPYRKLGFGRRLMEGVIDVARSTHVVEWVDLYVFGHNTAARALYEKLGFRETGTVVDRFRIDGQTIEDVMMTLKIE